MISVPYFKAQAEQNAVFFTVTLYRVSFDLVICQWFTARHLGLQ